MILVILQALAVVGYCSSLEGSSRLVWALTSTSDFLEPSSHITASPQSQIRILSGLSRAYLGLILGGGVYGWGSIGLDSTSIDFRIIVARTV